MKRRVFILLFVVFLGSLVFADAPFSVSVAGSANFPVINRELFSTGGGGGVTGSFRLGELQNFRGLAQLGYFYLPVQTVQKGLSVLSVITSYSIHYTKLYDERPFCTVCTGR